MRNLLARHRMRRRMSASFKAPQTFGVNLPIFNGIDYKLKFFSSSFPLESNERSRLIKITAAITVCDAEGIILEMNDKAAKTFEKDGSYRLVRMKYIGLSQ